MLFRNKKKDDPNEGKWIGVGGKFETGESAMECVSREVGEETGLTALDYTYRGLVHFRSDLWEDEEMYLFTASIDGKYNEQSLPECDEGEFKWIPKEEILSLRLWEGDRCFLEKLMDDEKEPFEMTLRYEGDKLVANEQQKREF